MCFIRVICFGTAFLTGPQVIKTLAVVIGKNPYWSTEATKNLLGRSVACDVHKFAKVDLVCVSEKQYRTESLDNYVKLLRGLAYPRDLRGHIEASQQASSNSAP